MYTHTHICRHIYVYIDAIAYYAKSIFVHASEFVDGGEIVRKRFIGAQ